MSLEEKLRALSPESIEKLETFVDFLLYQESSAGESDRLEHESTPVERTPEPRIEGKSPVRFKTDTSGIILAEERLDPAGSPEAIDFADINTRFAPPEKEEPKNSDRQRRSLDWL